jgi:caffeoyl-CoA O-methyltransferase
MKETFIIALAMLAQPFAAELNLSDEEIQRHLQWMRRNQTGMMNIAPEEGKHLHDLLVRMNAKRVLEVGTSNGYSGIWLAMALRKTGGKLITIEIDERRGNLAAENFSKTGLETFIDFRRGDALKVIPALSGPFDLVFIDAWKPDYKKYLDLTYPMLRAGGVVAAHNVVSHAADMKDFLDAIHDSERFKTEIVKAGPSGLSVSTKLK